jgi:hypothetical protein
MMMCRLSQTLGLVGSRHYEMQASRSPGAEAVEHAVWQSSAVPVVPALRKTLRVRLTEALRAIVGRRPAN